MSLANVPKETLEKWLAECREAEQALATGAQVAQASYAGHSVSYSKADLGLLRARIGELEAAIAGDPRLARRRAMGVEFHG